MMIRVNLKVASGLMKTYEVKTDVAGSGAEALKMIDSELYDIIFLDHMMPDMDGIETFRRLQKKEWILFQGGTGNSSYSKHCIRSEGNVP